MKIKYITLISLFVIVLFFVVKEDHCEGFEGTGLPIQNVLGRNTEFLPVGFNTPHEKVKNSSVDPFIQLDIKVGEMAKKLPMIFKENIPESEEFQIGNKQVESVSREQLNKIKTLVSERMTNVWNTILKDDGKWSAVNILEINTSNTISGINKVVININMIEENRLYSKDFVIELVKLPGIEIYQIVKATVEDGKQQSQIENILLRGPDPIASKLYNVVNASLNGEITKEERDIALVEKQKLLQSPGFICFGSKNPGAQSREECKLSDGYWDKPVQSSEECQFYIANKNYPNNRGGVRGSGFCELPLGMQPLGFRGIRSSENAKPLCYNCIKGSDGKSKTLGQCCEEQKNTMLYPTLQTPDYAFQGDQFNRQQQQNTLKFRGLSWHRRGVSFEDKDPVQLDSDFLPEISARALSEQKNPKVK